MMNVPKAEPTGLLMKPPGKVVKVSLPSSDCLTGSDVLPTPIVPRTRGGLDGPDAECPTRTGSAGSVAASAGALEAAPSAINAGEVGGGCNSASPGML